MRVTLALMLLAAQPLLADECLRIVSVPKPPQIVLRGVIHHRSEAPPPGAVSTFLKLSTPICIQGFDRDSRPFKKEGIHSIRVGAPVNILVTLRPADRVTLRGELWGPAVNGHSVDPVDDVTFAIKEVLDISPPRPTGKT
jgi:hypothetical protein